MKTMKTPFAIAVLTAALSGTAFAAGSGMSEADPMSTQSSEATGSQTYTYEGDKAEGHDMTALDLNQDQVISEDEAVGVPELADQWQDLDTNQDGQLDQTEFARFEPEGDSMGSELEEVQPTE